MQQQRIINPQTTVKNLIEQLRDVLDIQQQKKLLKQYAPFFDWNELLQAFKNEVDTWVRRTDGLALAERFVTLMFHCSLSYGDDYHRALALRAQGNYYLIGLRANKEAIECYQSAEEIYIQHNDTLGAAQAMIGATGALQELGRFSEAEAILQKIISVFDEHQQWLPLSNAYLNLAALYNYIGRDQDALKVAEQALSLVVDLGDQGKRLYPLIENNRALSLRNLGQFEESIESSRRAREVNLELGQTLEATRALSNTAFTYFLLDQYNQCLHLYEQCRNEYLSGGKERDAANSDLEYVDCLLQLCRYSQALELSHTIENEFRSFDAQPQLARLYMMQAVAYASKKPAEYDKALTVLSKSINSSQDQKNNHLVAQARLRAAFIYYLQGEYEESLTLAQNCAKILHQQSLAGDEAKAYLIGARAALRLGQYDVTQRLLGHAKSIAEQNPQTFSFLQYQIHVHLGDLARLQKEYTQAYTEYDDAIQQVEQLRSRLMVEFNADFLEDKQTLYQESVHLCITKLQKPEQAWHYVERAKSRALIDILAHRIDLKINSRHPSDNALVAQLEDLRSERNRLYRQLQALAKPSPFADSHISQNRILHNNISQWEITEEEISKEKAVQGQIVAQFVALQEEIETQWNRLLSRNADYERDALLAHVSLSQVQTYLPSGSCLLEYFIAKEHLFAFLITKSTIQVYPLGKLSKNKSILTFFQMNLQAVPRARPKFINQLTRQAQGHLYNLYTILLAPLAADLQACKHLIIVPHDFLHTLPFHALYDGTRYLIERYEISYLPCATLLHHCRQLSDNPVLPHERDGALVLGHTQDGMLPGRADESQRVAQLLNAQCFLDDQVTLARLLQDAPDHQIIHLATHGQFNASNPLFSGLALEDGELTTFDIFNMRLNASLVVLSACETAKAVVGGGDELLGLSRALFYAGAKSLVVSQWKVEDESTSQLMVAFYTYLQQGCTKRQALQKAQCQLMHIVDEPSSESTTQSTTQSIDAKHPFFWSAFFLMGDSDTL